MWETRSVFHMSLPRFRFRKNRHWRWRPVAQPERVSAWSVVCPYSPIFRHNGSRTIQTMTADAYRESDRALEYRFSSL